MGRSPTARTRRARRTSADSRSSTCPHARRRWSGLPRSPSPAAVLKRSASSCPTRRWATDRSPTWPVHATAPNRTIAWASVREWHPKGRLLRGRGKAALDAFVHARHQHVVAEAFPALLRVVNGDDRPAVSRRPGRVEDLPLGQAPIARMHGRDRRLVLLLRSAGKLMHDAVRHLALLPLMSRSLALRTISTA